MKQCAQCATEFQPKRRDSRFCSKRCLRNATRDRDEPCTEPGCQRPQRARGLCAMDWKRRYGKPTRYLITCEACGVEHRSARPDGKYCTDWCKGWAYAEKVGGNVCAVPDTHPVLSTRIPAAHPARRHHQNTWINKVYRIYIPDCRWCGKAFVTQQPAHVLCSKRCTRREAKAKRKALEHGAGGSYTWTQVIGLFLKFDRCCAYCRQPIAGQPDPDHVVPLSRGGSNSLTNILPSCRTCNSEKCDRTLAEWAHARRAKGLPPRFTSWETGDPLYVHLALGEATKPRWNAA